LPFEFSVIGNTNLDIIGLFDTLPSPDERVESEDWLISLGGSATNLAVAASSLGALPHLYTAIGTDEMSEIVKKEISRYKIAFHPIRKEGRQSVVFVASIGHKRTMFTLRGVSHCLIPDDLPEKPLGSLVHIASKGPEFAKRYIDVISTSYSPGASLFIDTHKLIEIKRIIPELDFLFLNEGEARRLEILHGEILPRKALIITRGKEGSIIYTREGVLKVESYAVENVVDTTGAGDVFAAAFLTFYHEERDIVQAARAASVSAGIAVTQYGGIVELDRNFIKEELKRVNAEWV